MPDPVSAYYQNAQLSMAAYAVLNANMSGAQYKAALMASDRFPEALAREFAGLNDNDEFIPGRGYSILSTSPNEFLNLNGFSATLFKNNSTGEKILAIRGTEPFTFGDIITDATLLVLGGVSGQYNSLQSYYLQLKNEAKLLPNEEFTVTGHSLGGFLAEAFTVDHPLNISHAYTYNAPGIGGAIVNTLSLIGVVGTSVPTDLITNIIAQGGPSFVASLGIQLGVPQNIFIELSPLVVPNHSVGRLTDSLALYDLFAKIDDAVTIPAVTDILRSAANNFDRPRSLEFTLDAVRKLFAFPGTTVGDTKPVDRDSYYQNLLEFEKNFGFTGTNDVNDLAGISAGDLKNLATDSLNYRYALTQLNPFVIGGVDYQALHNTHGELDRFNSATGAGELTDEYLTDRSAFLAQKIAANMTDDTGVPALANSTLFHDLASGYKIVPLGIQAGMIFGSSEADPIAGTALGDHIYGGLGNDVISADAGNDYVEGNDGNDTITGGKGDDNLKGGVGNDTYKFALGDGHDTIDDPFGANKIVFNQELLQGGTKLASASDFTSLDKTFGYHLSGADLLISDTQTSDTITVKNFQDGQFGIRLVNVPDTRAPSVPVINYGSNGFPNAVLNVPQDGHSYSIPRFGSVNYIVNGNNGGDSIFTDLGNDQLYGGALSDTLVGGAGDDLLSGGGGNDFMGGGTGSDTMFGGAGNDVLHADDAPPGVLYGKNPNDGSDYLDGGDGDDFMRGGAGNDVLLGGAGSDNLHGDDIAAGAATGNDYLDGGVGSDHLSGDGGSDVLLGGAGNDTLWGFGNTSYAASFDGNDYLDGGSGDDELHGDSDDDVLIGGDDNDILFGDGGGLPWEVDTIAGNDLLDGGDGNDSLIGGGGNDVLSGDAGDDALRGDDDYSAALVPGNDSLDGGSGNDQLAGDGGDDVVSGGDGNDFLAGDDPEDTRVVGGNDLLYGEAGDDQLQGGRGDDLLYGGDGNDVIFGDRTFADPNPVGGNDLLDGGTGDDQLFGDGGNDELLGGDGNDTLIGSTGNDTLDGGAGNDIYGFNLGDGHDVISDTSLPGEGNTLAFGAGISLANLTLTPDEGAHTLTIQVGGGGDTITLLDFDLNNVDGSLVVDTLSFSGLGSVSLASRFPLPEGLVNGTAANDVIFTGAGDDVIQASQGNDTINAGAGNDVLDGGPGDDVLKGGSGSDTYIFGLGYGHDSIQESDFTGTDTDTIHLLDGVAPGDVTLQANQSNGVVLKIAGATDDLTITNFLTSPSSRIDQIAFADGTVWDSATIGSKLQGTTFTGTNGPDTLQGTSLDDVLTGLGGDDTLSGLAGNDVLDGGTGDDILQGGSGSDTYIFGRGYGHDTIQESDPSGTDTDTIQLLAGIAPGDVTLQANQSNGVVLKIAGATDDLTITNFLTSPSSRIDQIAFADGTVWDSATIGSKLQGTTFTGTNGPDTLQGTSLDDVLTGLGGGDTLSGLAGNDVLDGGTGNDILQGGSGSDTYIFGRGYGHDSIQESDFTGTDTDTIHLLDGIVPGDVTLQAKINNDLVLQIAGTADDLTMTSFFQGASSQIELIAFADGTVWDFDTIVNRTQGLTVTGIGGPDFLFGTAVKDVLIGLGGNDFLNGGAGADQLLGGPGDDTYVVDNAGDAVTELAGEGTDTVKSSVNYTLPANVENLTLTNTFDQSGAFDLGPFAIHGIGNSLDNVLTGNTGDNVLEGGAGSDVLEGGSAVIIEGFVAALSGNDTLIGGPGSDTYVFNVTVELPAIVGFGNETIIDSSNASDTNTVMFGPGQDGFRGISAGLVKVGLDSSGLVIQVNNDPLNFPGGPAVVGVIHIPNFDPTNPYGPHAIDSFKFTDGTVFTYRQFIDQGIDQGIGIVGTAGNDTIAGTSGPDRIDGSSGADKMVGGLGDDTYVVENTGDVVVEAFNEGIDTVLSAINNYVLGSNVENLRLTGNAPISGFGNTLDNVLIGNSAINLLAGRAGNDTYVMGAVAGFPNGIFAPDIIIENPNEGIDTVLSEIPYTLPANVENLTLTGSANIFGVGNSLDNVLTGNRAQNSLSGGLGNDTYVIGATAGVPASSFLDTILENPNAGIDTVQTDVTYTLVANLENLTLTGTAAINGTGNALSNIITSNSGNNVLAGGAGDDTYVFNAGGGVDTIQDISTPIEGNALQFGAGINLGDLNFAQSGNLLTIAVGGNGDAVRLTNFDQAGVNGSLVAKTLKFADGLQVNLVDLLSLPGTEGDDLITGGPGDDLIIAKGGNDLVRSDGGNDTVAGGIGNDRLEGETGDDHLYGGLGDDTYIFAKGDGHDSIDDISSPGAGNTLSFGVGIKPEDLLLAPKVTDTVTGAGNSVDITVGNGGDLINIGHFTRLDVYGTHAIDTFQFADGTVLSYQQLVDRGFDMRGTDNNDTLLGTNTSDRISGFGGSDVLFGHAGKDTLVGGAGNDIYAFEFGDGVDTIQDTATSSDGNRIVFVGTIRVTDLKLSQGPNTLTIAYGAGGDAIQLAGFDPNNVTGSLVVKTLQFSDGNSVNLADLLPSANVNQAPTVATPIPDQTRAEDVPFTFQVPTNTFSDPDLGDVLTYSASLATGASLPAWLSFNAATRTFNGLADDAQVGTLGVKVTATDTGSLSASDIFNLTITNVNEFPLVAHSIADQTTAQDALFSLVVPTNTFADPDVGDTLTYSASLATGASLPAWLSFNAGSHTFNGTPHSADVATISVKLTATDAGNLSATDVFGLTVSGVSNPPIIGTPAGDILSGTSSDDVIDAGAGSDIVDAGPGNDMITGGPGNDTLNGGPGNDTYVFNLGDGVDTINDDTSGGDTNTLVFGDGITPNDLSLGLGSLVIKVGAGSDAIHITNFDPNNAYGPHAIDRFGFAGGTVLSYSQLIDKGFDLTGTAGNDTIVGTSAADRIIGLAGNDTMSGGAGNDTYLLNVGDGADTILDTATASEGNSIVFGAGITVADLRLTQEPNTLTIAYDAGGDAVQLADFDPSNVTGSLVVNTLQFSDGSTANLADLLPSGNENQAPTVANPLADVTTAEDSVFSLIVPGNTFVDPDTGDTLTYNATLEDNSPLPAWLAFDAATQKFTGTPDDAQVGTVGLKVTATDSGNLSAGSTFELTITNVNEAPTVAHTIADQTTAEDAPFSLVVPMNTFADPDAGDTLTYSASLTNGAALPAWLSFNATTRSFSGAPVNDDVGTVSVQVTATDTGAFSTSDSFALTVTNVNDRPTVVHVMADQNTLEDGAFSFQLPDNMFADVDTGDVLTYEAMLADGLALPAWLSFDAVRLRFTGTPNNGDVGSGRITVTARDIVGLSAVDTFVLSVSNVNDAPTVAHALADQNTLENTPFSFQVPGNTFGDVDAGDTLTYSTLLADGSDLPAWLSFNTNTATFSGTPQSIDQGTINVKVTATDTGNLSAADIFGLTVTNVTTLPALALSYGGKLADKVGQGDLALGADDAQDGTFTLTLAPGSGNRTITSLDLRNSVGGAVIGVWDTVPGDGYWALGAATGVGPSLLNSADSSVNVPLAEGGNLTLLASDLNNSEFVPGANFTLTANFADGTSASATTTVGSLPPPPALALSYDGMLRDNVGQDNGARTADGRLDGTFTLALASGSGNRTITSLDLRNSVGGIWDSFATSPYWTLGVASGLDGLVLQSGSDSVNVALGDDGSVTLFASDWNTSEFVPGTSFTVVAGFGDGTSASATTTVGSLPPSPALALSYGGMLRDNVGQDNGERTADGRLDGTFTLTLASGSGNRTITSLDLRNSVGGIWDSFTTSPYWTLGVASGLDGLLLQSGSDSVSVTLGDDGSVTLFASDWNTSEFVPGTSFTVVASFGDGTSASAATTIGGSHLPTSTDGDDVLNLGPDDDVVDAGAGNDIVNGGAGKDTLSGGTGSDLLDAGPGDDELQNSIDDTWSSNFVAYNAGSPGHPGTGQTAAIAGKNRSFDVFSGGDGMDTLLGSSGDDALFLDDLYSPFPQGIGSRFAGVEVIKAGDGEDIVDLTSSEFNYGDVTLDGGKGNDILWASGGNDVLIGGPGNDSVVGGAGNDTYQFARGDGQDTIIDHDTTPGNHDAVVFGSNLSPSDLVLSRQADNLRIAIHGSSDAVTVQDWYKDSANETEAIQAGNGSALVNTQVDQLIQAMAAYSASSGLTWDQAIDQRPDDVQAILVASWH